MARMAIGLTVAVWLLAGCGSSMPPPATSASSMLTDAQQCIRGGGWWRQSLGVCDMQGTGVERH